MKINVKGLKFQNWMYLMIFSVIILVVLWVLQFLFLGSFYQGMKLNETKSVGDKITDQFDDTDFHTIMDEYAFNNNLRIILLDESGRMTGNFDGFPEDTPGMRPPGGLGTFPVNSFNTVKEKLSDSSSDRICYLSQSGRGGMSQAIYVAKVYNTSEVMYYLYISSSIPPIDSTISVLKTQFIIITMILFILSLIVSMLISRKMSKPIVSLTKSAERLIKGELDENFYDDGFTEIHQLASAMNYAADELRNLDNYRREFIANVSHDLKTPLTIIKFYGEMIKDVSGNNPEKRNAHCDTIIKESDWLTSMVEEILELSKLEANHADVAKTEFDLSGCLEEILVSFQALSVKSGYFFETEIEKDLCVFGNEPMLRRVLYNLISNAVNFTGEDKRICISLKAENGFVCFKVTDTGEGIPKEYQNAIWDRYYKSKQSHKRAVIGTGLGLSIVKNVLTLMGAEYGVTSEQGKGSTFWFEIDRCFI